MKRFSTGYKAFDAILDGGIVEGSSLLVVGYYGVGKTTLLRKLHGNCEVLYGQRPSKGKDIYILEEIHSPAQALQDLKNFDEKDKTRVFVCLPHGSLAKYTPGFDAVVQIELKSDGRTRRISCLKNRFGSMKKTEALFQISGESVSWLGSDE